MPARSLYTTSFRGLASIRAAPITTRQAFSTSSRLSLKESSSQSDVDYEGHKQDSLKKQKDGKGEWKRSLASDSEEAVRAEKNSEGGTKDEEIARLQQQTKKASDEERGSK